MPRSRRRKVEPGRPWRSRAAVGALVLGVAGAALVLTWWPGGGGPLPRAPGRDVVVISVDTLRADALGAYGRASAGTGAMDRLAAEGVRFEAARAHNVVTLPSHASLLSGRLPLAHGVRDNSGFRFPKDVETLATVLQARGYRTGAFVSAFVLDSRFGLDRGFDVYDDHVGGTAGRGGFVVAERAGPRTVAAALRWLEAGGERPSLLFVHVYEPHAPYEPSEPFASRFPGAPYQAEVAAADAALAPLFDRLLGSGPGARPSLVVLTSDHGEGLGEHEEETHGVFAYDTTLRVPLVLHARGLLRPRLVSDPVRLVDVMPTVLDLLGIELPAPLDGRSLLPLCVSRRLPPADTYFEALSASLDRGWAPLHGLVSGSLKYVDLPLPELYDLERDPGERDNLAARRPADLERLSGRLSEVRSGERPAGPRVTEDAAARERLRALGYVSGGGAPSRDAYGPEDDPKRLVGLERREAEILRRYREGDFDGARALCRQSLAERPGMALAWTQLASIERARGALAAAAEAGRRAVALRPGDPASVALLGGILVEAGRPEEAREVLAPLVGAEADPDALIADGMALARLGRPREALAAFARARSLDPGNPDVLVDEGTVHLMTGAVESAAAAFTAALAIDPGSARAHNGLGVVAARRSRVEEALEHWSRAVALDPRDYRSLFNLGATLRRAGREAEARRHLEAYLRVVPPALEPEDVARVRAWLASSR